ncbi:hypothetical protein ACWWJF_22345 [Symbiopectobacterium sp. Eva_TO]
MLSLNKLSAIRKIMEEMPDEVIEDCYAEAEQLAEKSIERFRDPLRKHWPDAYTEQACEYMEDSDVDYQETESHRIFDAIFHRVKVERAFWIYDRQNSTEDAA